MSFQAINPGKLDLNSMDISAENRAKLKQLFPAVFTETKNENGKLVDSIDFEKLRAELGTFSDVFESRRERYGMDWPGKKDCMKIIQQPSVATLKPCREESVNFDSTENLFIEGDNLEVLKLLQKSYYGKVKMIYIDPPYNTGNEFIYPDNYTESLDTYLAYAGLVDDEGKKFSTNTLNEGRFHTKWMNMIYPRLYLARNLLCEDGVVFISIDDNEVSNLQKLCNNIFGEENFVANITRIAKTASNKGTHFAPSTDYILVYAKNRFQLPVFTDEVDKSLYKKKDEKGYYRDDVALYQSALDSRANQRYFIKCPDGSFAIPPGNTMPALAIDGEKVTPEKNDGVWRWTPDTYYKNISLLVFKKSTKSPLLNEKGEQSKYNIYTKSYLKDREEIGTRPRTFIEILNRKASDYLKRLDIPFDYSKPKELVHWLLNIVNIKDGEIVLDFFAGSATTAEAVFDLNYENGSKSKFIMVQLPEPCDEDSEAYKAGYQTIANIGKERIRRVIKKIEEEKAKKTRGADDGLPGLEECQPQLDLGFKVFKLDKSNFKIWDGSNTKASEEEIIQQLALHIDHIDPNATQEDILYELLLKAGFMPTQKMERLEMAGKTVFSIAEGALLICLENQITRELIDAVAEAEPMQFICLDLGFGGKDQLKANAVQTFAARNQGRDKAEQIVFRTV